MQGAGQRATAGASIGFQIHDLAKQMRVHREHRAEQEREPWHLGDAVQPTREHEDEQVTSLAQDVETRTPLERERSAIVQRSAGECGLLRDAAPQTPER